MANRSREDDEEENPIQIANSENNPSALSNIYKAVSPALEAIIPSAEAGWRDTIRPIGQKPFKKIDQVLTKKTPERVLKKISQQDESFVPPSQDEIKQFAIDEARKRGLDPAMVLSHIQKESSFNPSAYTSEGKGTGARGLLQIRGPAFGEIQQKDKTGMLKNLKHEDLNNPKNWKEGLVAGLDYYKRAKQMWKGKNMDDVLRNYFQGYIYPHEVEKKKRADDYVKKIHSFYPKHKEYVNKLDQQRQRELASTNVDSGEEIAADKMDVIKNIKKLMMP